MDYFRSFLSLGNILWLTSLLFVRSRLRFCPNPLFVTGFVLTGKFFCYLIIPPFYFHLIASFPHFWTKNWSCRYSSDYIYMILNLQSSQYHKYSFKLKIYPSPHSHFFFAIYVQQWTVGKQYMKFSWWHVVSALLIQFLRPELYAICGRYMKWYMKLTWWHIISALSVWWTNLCMMVVGDIWWWSVINDGGRW